ncbi:MAG TPA: TonB-dependent receptor [Tenuifilaceae bacterium]|nr:TonB-dependent receptor [Tenuifilaceae bacterium]
MTKVALHFSHKTLRYFKRWTNKSYGVFASLGVMVKICVMSFAYLIIVHPGLVSAQSDSLKIGIDAEIEEVVISDELRAITFSELSGAVFVIKQADIQSFPVSSVQKLLELLTSVDIRQRGEHGVQADVLIRGGSFDQVLILLNGVNITDPQTGHHNLNIPVDLKSVQKIEILQGAGVRSYGVGAYSGIINIITSPNGNSFVNLSTTVGEYGLLKLFSNTAVSNKKSEISFSASSSKSDGFMENTDFSIANLFAQGKVKILNGYFDFQLGVQDKGFGAQSFYTPRYPNQYEQVQTLISSASYHYKFRNVSFTPLVYYRTHTDRFELFRSNEPQWYLNHNHHKTRVMGGSLHLSYVKSNGKLKAGAEVRNESIVSNVLGDLLTQKIPVSGFQNVFYTKGKDRLVATVFTDYTYYFKNFSISAGLQIVGNRYFGTSLNYGFDISTYLVRNFKTYMSCNRATRYPTFTDLYYSGPTNIGNPNLMPEVAETIELGVKHQTGVYRFNASVFHRKGYNIIDWVKYPNDEKWTTTNYTRLSTNGFETSLNLFIESLAPVAKNILLSYTYIDNEKDKDYLLSYYTMDFVRSKLSAGVGHNLFKKLNISWLVIWQDRAGTYTDFSTNNEKSYAPFLTVDLNLSYKIHKIELFAEISNLFNTRYHDIGNVPQPGRWVAGGLNFLID